MDESWTVTIGGQTVQVNPDGSFLVPNVAAPDQFGPGGPGTAPDFISDDFVRAVAISKAGGGNGYAFSEPFQFRNRETFIVGQLTFTDTPPPFPEALMIVAPTTILNQIGQTNQLTVTGTLVDGSPTDLTQRSNWTVYRTSNPAVATVGENGLVTAQGEGTVFITAVNEGATGVKRLRVLPDDPLTTLEGFVQLEDGTPVEGALVNVVEEGINGMSDASGFYSINNVPTSTGSASVRITSGSLTAVVPNVEPVPAAITDMGIAVLGERTPGFLPFGDQVSLSDDSQTSIGPMPFPFEFFGQPVVGDMVLNANGILTFNNTSVSSSFNNYPFPLGSNSVVAPFFDDINPGVGGLIGVFDDTGTRAITWELVPYFGRTENVTFQAAFHSDGVIEFRYAGMASPPGGTADSGLSVGTATIGLAHLDDSVVPFLGSIINKPDLSITNEFGILDADGLARLDELEGNDILLFSPDESGSYNVEHNPSGDSIAQVLALRVEGHEQLVASAGKRPGIKVDRRDTDGDGMPDAAESIAGTDPYSAESVFVVRSVTRNADQLSIEWDSVVRKAYLVEYASEIGANGWHGVEKVIATDSQSSIEVDVTGKQGFFRIRVVDDVD